MKKTILLLSIVLVSFTAFSFAAAPAISKNVVSSFNKQFSNARDIKWENGSNFVKAQFTVNDKVLFAYFNNNGELIAVTHFITSDKLPPELFTSLKKVTSSFWISDLFEIQTESATEYYATLENADQIIVLKSDGTNGWQIYQREKKENAE